MLPQAELDLSLAQLRSLSIRTDYDEMHRIQGHWSGLTTFPFEPSALFPGFLHNEVMNILRLTSHLIRCIMGLCFVFNGETPSNESLTLSKLESLTGTGCTPPHSFAAALHLPALTRLYTDEVTNLSLGRGEAGAVFVWAQSYWAQLKEVTISSSERKGVDVDGVAVRGGFHWKG